MGRKSKKQKREENLIGSLIISVIVVTILGIVILIVKRIFGF